METCIYVLHQKKHLKVDFEQILFVQSASNYSIIHTLEKSYVVSKTLLDLENRGLPDCMKRIHRSYIVNLEHIDSFDNEYIYIRKFIIPISKNRWKNTITELRLW